MKIETKFQPKDWIYTLIDFKIRRVQIAKISIELSDYSDKKELNINKEITYYVNKGTKENYSSHSVKEENCYISKGELLKSIE